MLPHERVHTGSKSESVAEIKRLGSLVDCCVFFRVTMGLGVGVGRKMNSTK